MTPPIKTCSTCALSVNGFFCSERLYCGKEDYGQMKEVEPDGWCGEYQIKIMEEK